MALILHPLYGLAPAGDTLPRATRAEIEGALLDSPPALAAAAALPDAAGPSPAPGAEPQPARSPDPGNEFDNVPPPSMAPRMR